MIKQVIAISTIIFLVKIFIVFHVDTPWIFSDEVMYSETSRSIINDGNLRPDLPGQNYPPLYSLLLVFANIFENVEISHKISLIINSVITTLIFPLSYIFLKEIVQFKKISILVALIVSVIPSIFPYSFVIMSENLFIVLFLLLNILLIRSWKQHNQKFWIITYALAFLLFLTRAQGIVQIIALMLISIIYLFIYKNQKKKIFIAFAFSISIFIIYQSILKISGQSTGYNNKTYINNIINWFTEDGVLLFLKLFLNEINFIYGASFGVGFIGFAILVYISIKKIYDSGKIDGHLILLLFNVLCILGTTLLTIAHMYEFAKNSNHPEHNFYFIFGRYLDPFIPIILLYGLHLFLSDYKLKVFHYIGIFISLFVFLITIPTNYYKFPNMFGIWYIKYYGFTSFILLLVIVLLFLLSQMNYLRKYQFLSLLFLLSVSILASYSTLYKQFDYINKVSVYTPLSNWFIEYKQNNKIEKIYYDVDNFDITSYYTLDYWTGNTKMERISGLGDNYKKMNFSPNSFVVSSKFLPFSIVYAANNKKIYDPNTPLFFNYNQNFIDIGKDDELYTFGMNIAENEAVRWTKGSSQVILAYGNNSDLILGIKAGGKRPDENPAKSTLYLNNKKIGEFTKSSGWIEKNFFINRELLQPNYQLLEINTNTWSPSQYGSTDNRIFGILLDWIQLKQFVSNDDINFIDIGRDDNDFVFNFHGVENNMYRWTTEDSLVILPYKNKEKNVKLIIELDGSRPEDDPAKGQIIFNNNLIGKFTKESGKKHLEFEIDKELLFEKNQSIKILVNTWNPSKYGSNDNRDLGVMLDSIRIED